jgi:hypothetical protein
MLPGGTGFMVGWEGTGGASLGVLACSPALSSALIYRLLRVVPPFLAARFPFFTVLRFAPVDFFDVTAAFFLLLFFFADFFAAFFLATRCVKNPTGNPPPPLPPPRLPPT